MFKVTNNTYVRNSDYNDHVFDKNGTAHAQGSHDINRNCHAYNADGTKAAWHKVQRNRRRQFWTAKNRDAGLRKIQYAQVDTKTWAVNARVNSDDEVVICDGYTSRPVRQRRNPRRSRLAELCN
jgi:hypothetical protein